MKPQAEAKDLEIDALVAEQFALLQANRERRQAIEALDQGNLQSALISLAAVDKRLADLPQSVAVQRERQLLAEKRVLMHQDRNLSRKRLHR